MLCKSVKSNKYWRVVFLVGIITLTFGVTSHKSMTGISPNMSMLNGMVTGVGFAFTVVGGIKLIQNKMTPAEKLKSKQIELNDERNIQILRISYSISSTVATILFATLAFLFVGFNYIVPAFISIGAMYIQILAFFIANMYYNKKM